jgi:hypothetical protein
MGSDPMPLRLLGDFNGLFGDVLCLSHDETCLTPEGERVAVSEGMLATALEPDIDEGKPAELYATGLIERAPDWLACRGSRWVLKIDEHGIRWRPPSGPATSS